MSALCYICNWFSVVVLHRSMVDWRGYVCHRYMSILLYVKLIRCSGVPEIYGRLEEGGLYAFLNTLAVLCFASQRSFLRKTNKGNILSICHVTAFFDLFSHIHVNNFWNICDRNFKLFAYNLTCSFAEVISMFLSRDQISYIKSIFLHNGRISFVCVYFCLGY